MAKIRVYELAKELGLDNKEILAKLRTLKIPVKSHMSVVPEEDVDRIKQSLTQEDGVKAAGGIEEKRVARGIIRRRARPTAEEPEEEAAEEKAKLDLETLKHTKKARREEEAETSGKPEPALEEIPEEWAVEEEEEQQPVPEEPAPEPEPEEPPKKTTTKKKAKKEEPEPAETQEAAPVSEKTAEIAAQSAAEKPAEEPEEKKEVKKKKGPRRIYMKPTIRKTARAPEGEPVPIPGQAPAPKPAPGPAEPAAQAPAEEEGAKKKKKKKKKRGKGAAEEEEKAEMFTELSPKRRLRRKVAFKMQKGMEGMEIADVEQMYVPSRKKITGKKKVARKTEVTTPKAAKRIVKMGEYISAMDLAKQLGVKADEIMRALRKEGVNPADTQRLDVDMATLIAAAYDYEMQQEVFDENKVLGLVESEDKKENLVTRPPVVTVMGHVDHGKTSLLDTIRKTRVTEGEAGAITQHIGASLVETSSGKITFVDTPGHEAFTSMRARGAKVTDIVVLVVAADDGIMPQTVEAANHAKAAGVPIIVAINKIDLPNANPQNVMQRLTEIGLQPEDWGGETQVIQCSAKSGQGVPDLLEAILLQAEILELSADPAGPARCFVIESRLDKGRGPVATVVVQQGTLKRGDAILSGVHSGKVRAMLDDRGKQIKKAGPSIPVEIMGLSGVPEPGDELIVVQNDKKAKEVAQHRELQLRQSEMPTGPQKVSLEDLMAKLEQGEVQQLNIILKADTNGSAEAVKQSVEKLANDEVKVQVLHSGVGNVTENDVLLASASTAVIIGFNVKPEASAKKLAEKEKVQIRIYDIIYNLIDDVKASMEGMLEPVFEEKILGRAEVRKTFRVTKVGTVAGSYVTEGTIKRGARARVLRDGIEVHTGKIKTVKRVTEDVKEVGSGLECGINLESFNDIQEGDIVEAFEMNEVSR